MPTGGQQILRGGAFTCSFRQGKQSLIASPGLASQADASEPVGFSLTEHLVVA